ncbi:amidohydrolase family protein [Burkholderia diffusa]|uniref:amidohydrolase family protein n=1 Tax=Burkholderia diffusa TaxID=488732 RepID=UPI00158B430E|nr:amidohydrolase family protein [Burkholderia diffusa]
MTSKRFEGRDEPVIDPELPIIDAHHHLFDRPTMRYMLDDYLADANAGHNIVASVYMEIQTFARTNGPEVLRPIGEVEFANGVAAMCASGRYGNRRVCAGIVGYADMRHGDSVATLLDRAIDVAPDRFRGIRQICIEHSSEAPFRYMSNRPPSGVMQSPAFRQAFRHLASRGLSFDAAVFHQQLPEVAELARAFPDTTIVLNHLGLAMALDMDQPARMEVFRDWREKLRALSRHPNIVCKIGGFGMPFWGFGFEQRTDPIASVELAAAWQPYVETAVEAFGPGRCMMESNYPPDAMSCGFVPLWNALKRTVAGASREDKAALFHDTAARVYRLDLGAC